MLMGKVGGLWRVKISQIDSWVRSGVSSNPDFKQARGAQ